MTPLDPSIHILGPFGRLTIVEHRIDDALTPWLPDHDERADAAASVFKAITRNYPNAIISGSCFIIVPVRQADITPPAAA